MELWVWVGFKTCPYQNMTRLKKSVKGSGNSGLLPLSIRPIDACLEACIVKLSQSINNPSQREKLVQLRKLGKCKKVTGLKNPLSMVI